jgi:hypothetical protein
MVDPRYAMTSDAGTFGEQTVCEEEEADEHSQHIIFRDAGDSFTIDKPSPS